MKLTIFLDIDGVLNHEPRTEECGDALMKYAGDLPLGGFSLLCPRCIQRLDQLIKDCYSELYYDEVDIVCSSTWRNTFTPAELTAMLTQAGDFSFELVGKTETNSLTRGQQILNYLEKRPSDAYLVLDDDIFDMQLVAHRQVVTATRTGFTAEKQREAFNLILEIQDT